MAFRFHVEPHDVPMDEDMPIRLQEACDRFFGGRLTPKSLRAEARKGNLTIERIANKDFVTRAAIMEMRRKCRIASAPRPLKAAFLPPIPADIPLATELFIKERDALLAKLKARRRAGYTAR